MIFCSSASSYNTLFHAFDRLEYIVISKAEHFGKTCTLRVLNDNGMIRDLEFKMNTQPAANALYRSVTEMHSFFCCDTVHNDVSAQFNRDFKGMLASIFNVNTTLGKSICFAISLFSTPEGLELLYFLDSPQQTTNLTY